MRQRYKFFLISNNKNDLKSRFYCISGFRLVRVKKINLPASTLTAASQLVRSRVIRNF